MSLLSWLKQLFSDEPPVFRPRPAEWNKTLDDLDAEKRSLTGEEIEWARDYEREQLKSWARFPKDGEVFEAIDDISVTFQVSWNGPYGTGGQGVIPKGTQVRVSVYEGDHEPIGVYATPIEEKKIEAALVGEMDRLSSSYRGYGLFFKTAQLNRDFQIVESRSDVSSG